MDRMAMPAAAPQQSRSTSVTWPERPATKSCIVSSTVGTKAQNTAVANNAPRDTVRRGTKGLRGENAQNEILGEVRGLPHEKIRDPFAREAERAQKALHRLDDGEAQRAAPLPGDQ